MRDGRRFAIALVLVAACATRASEAPVTTTTAPAVTTTAPATTTTASAPNTTASAPLRPMTVTLDMGIRADGSTRAAVLRLPGGADDAPLVVLFHGAAVSTGSVAALAESLVESGAVVLAPETLISEATGPSSIPVVFPVAIDDGACAVRFALDHAAEWGADTSRLVVVGHAAGGNVGAFVALDPVSSDGSCRVDADAVAGYVGLSSNPAATAEIGSDFRYVEGDSELEQRLDIRRLLGRNPDLQLVLLTMSGDSLAPVQGIRDFVALTDAADYTIELIELPGSSHSILIDPDSGPGTTALEAIRGMIGL